MLDLGWTELLLIGIVALIVVGPKDLPGMFQAFGKFVGKAKGMAREFSRAMNDAADQSGVSDIQKSFKAASNPMKSAMDEVRKSTDSVKSGLSDAEKAARNTEADDTRLSDERKAQADRIREKSGEMAEQRRAAEAATSADPGAAQDAQPGTDEGEAPDTKAEDKA